jgi:hypothetical protein
MRYKQHHCSPARASALVEHNACYFLLDGRSTQHLDCLIASWNRRAEHAISPAPTPVMASKRSAPPSSPASAPSSAFAPSTASAGASFEAAWKLHEARIRAAKPASARAVNIDLVSLGAQVERVARGLGRYRARLARLPDFDLALFDELPSLARAVMWCGLEGKAMSKRPSLVLPLLREARAVRRKLHVALLAKAAFSSPPERPTKRTRKTPPAPVVPPLGSPRETAAQVAVGLSGLVAWLRTHGLDGTPVRPIDLDAAEELAERLLTVASPQPNHGVPEAVRELRLLRAKALTLLRETYAEVQAGVRYVGRREGERVLAEAVPMLGGLRKKRGTKAGAKEAKETKAPKRKQKTPAGNGRPT